MGEPRFLFLSEPSGRSSFPKRFWFGLVAMVAAEILMFAGIEPFHTYFTPIIWVSFILFVDGWTHARSSRSLISERPSIWPILLPASVVWWLLFEFYNCYLENWHYIGMPTIPIRYPGYVVSFATIFPGIFCTAELLLTFPFFREWRGRKHSVTSRGLLISFVLGLIAVAFPLFVPNREVRHYLFAPVWVGYIFMVEPVLYSCGSFSLFRAWEKGRLGVVATYLSAGVVCGLLWEFWNYWAGAKWLYTVPVSQTIRYFEMPALGFLGFIPFAWECYALFSLTLVLFACLNAVRRWIEPRRTGLAWGFVLLIAVLLFAGYLSQPRKFFRIDALDWQRIVSCPVPPDSGLSELDSLLSELENLSAPQAAERLSEFEFLPGNHTWADLHQFSDLLRHPEDEIRHAAHSLLRSYSVKSRFCWAGLQEVDESR